MLVVIHFKVYNRIWTHLLSVYPQFCNRLIFLKIGLIWSHWLRFISLITSFGCYLICCVHTPMPIWSNLSVRLSWNCIRLFCLFSDVANGLVFNIPVVFNILFAMSSAWFFQLRFKNIFNALSIQFSVPWIHVAASSGCRFVLSPGLTVLGLTCRFLPYTVKSVHSPYHTNNMAGNHSDEISMKVT